MATKRYEISDEEVDALWLYFIDQAAGFGIVVCTTCEYGPPCPVCKRQLLDLLDLSKHPVWRVLADMAMRIVTERDKGKR